MSNPYEAPAESSVENVSPSVTRSRPRGIAFLSVIAMLSGAIMLVLPILFIAAWDDVASRLQAEGASPELVLATTIVNAIVGIASGFSMWRGYKWGWWLGCFNYCYAIASGLATLVRLLAIDSIERTQTLLMAQLVGGTLFSAFIVWYFFRRNVLNYFKLQSLNQPKSLAVLAVASIVAAGLVSFLPNAIFN